MQSCLSTHIAASLSEKAKALGFLAIGFLAPSRPPHFDHFLTWLARRRNGAMTWMERNVEIRADPVRLLEGCRTVISLAYPYPVERPATPDGFAVARYTQPLEEDYHPRVKGLCRELVLMIREVFPDSRSRVFVDSAPLLERSIAFAAGLGFIGKNNMLIVPGHGSYLYLAEILTTAPLAFTSPEPMKDGCGPCMLCVEACPTGALESPFTVDAARCLSYLTVEYEGVLTAEAGMKMAPCFLGCDRCQEACPYNGDPWKKRTSLPAARDILAMDEGTFRERLGMTALSRAGLDRVKRNILAIKGRERPPSCPG
ncbi:MAG: tRNA epoxyqueuosine(34) reductase QueG [Deltaproteobacteria bacterium]|nr:tRNA epoxyqueuosine(34) reductase QueG [Deltaproteobacteria bacterium]